MTKQVTRTHASRTLWSQAWLAAYEAMKAKGLKHPKLELMRALGYRTHAPSGRCHAATDFYAAHTRGIRPTDDYRAEQLLAIAGMHE